MSSSLCRARTLPAAWIAIAAIALALAVQGTSVALAFDGGTVPQFGTVTDWQLQNPLPAAGALGDVKFVNATTGWAIGDRTVIKTTDGGLTWAPIPAVAEYQVTKLRFFDAQHGWLLNDDGVILRTANGGASWTRGDTGMALGLVDVSFVSTSTGFGFGRSGTFEKSTDGGATWQQVGSVLYAEVSRVCFLDLNTGWLFAPGRGLKTTDGGRTWHSHVISTGSDATVGSATFASASVGWVTAGDGVFATKDGGTTWNQQTLPGDNVQRIGTVCCTDENHAWVPAIDVTDVSDPFFPLSDPMGLVYRTEDGGAHWERSDVAAGTTPSDVSFSDNLNGWVTGWTLDSRTAAVLAHTADGGKTWTSLIRGTTDQLWDVSALTSSTAIAVGESGTVLVTRDAGTTWAPRSVDTTQNLWALASTDASHAWAVGDGGVILRTTDAGDTWDRQTSGTSEPLGATWFVDAQRGWVAGSAGTLLHTTDGGTHWTPAPSVPATSSLYYVQFLDDQIGWVVAADDESSRLYSTTNGGTTWRRVDPGLAGPDVNTFSFADALHGWASDYWGDVAYTADGGATWTQEYIYTEGSLDVLHAIDASTAVALTTDGEIFKTVDAGRVWWAQDNAGGVYRDVDFADADNGWVVGVGGIIAHTSDGGGAVPPTSTIAGTVYSAKGHEPLAGARVTLDPRIPAAVTDSSGHFFFAKVPPGEYEDAQVSAPGYVSASLADIIRVDGGDHWEDQGLDVVLKLNTVVTATSSGIRGAKASIAGVVKPARKATVSIRIDRLSHGAWKQYRTATVVSAKSGKFSYRSKVLPRGTYRIRASIAGSAIYGSGKTGWFVLRAR